ncbi:MAG: type I restriction endonuclease subunit R, partial [Myxococcales bacterium]|nr:type I restriction endonuclease subunit R [Myxococcales bacterium]
MSLRESTAEAAALDWFQSLGYAYRPGAHIAPGEPEAERDAYTEVLLARRVRDAIERLNPHLPPEAREDAFRRIARPAGAGLALDNRAFHEMLVEGVEVEFRRDDGRIVGDRARLVDFEDPRADDWLVVNQFTVSEGGHNRRPDVVVFLNGLPIAVIELKNAAS